ncbi:MAG: hypothetical protein IH841_03895 [Thaumarchaeota archaeon]|nr:hypothetical protein [Nitrososphaerota archaeon]
MSEDTTIKIKGKVLSDLRKVKGQIQSKSDEKITFNETIQELIAYYKKRHR